MIRFFAPKKPTSMFPLIQLPRKSEVLLLALIAGGIYLFPLIQLPRKSEAHYAAMIRHYIAKFPLIQLPRKSEGFNLKDKKDKSFH